MTRDPVNLTSSSRSRFWGRLLSFAGIVVLACYAAHAELRLEAMRQWEADARAAGLKAEVQRKCAFRCLERFDVCRTLLFAAEPRVSISSEDELFTLFGLKHRCPAGLRIECSSGTIRAVMALLARKALDAEVIVFHSEDNLFYNGNACVFGSSERTPLFKPD